VLLIDDHPGVVRQVADLLPEGFEVVAALHDTAAVNEAMETSRPDLVVLDITLPGMSGIELAYQIRSSSHSPKLVFLTVHDDPDYVRAAFSAGGSGYVVKARLATDLIPALESVMEGSEFISPGKACTALLEPGGTDADFAFTDVEDVKGTIQRNI